MGEDHQLTLVAIFTSPHHRGRRRRRPGLVRRVSVSAGLASASPRSQQV